MKDIKLNAIIHRTVCLKGEVSVYNEDILNFEMKKVNGRNKFEKFILTISTLSNGFLLPLSYLNETFRTF